MKLLKLPPLPPSFFSSLKWTKQICRWRFIMSMNFKDLLNKWDCLGSNQGLDHHFLCIFIQLKLSHGFRPGLPKLGGYVSQGITNTTPRKFVQLGFLWRSILLRCSLVKKDSYQKIGFLLHHRWFGPSFKLSLHSQIYLLLRLLLCMWNFH